MKQSVFKTRFFSSFNCVQINRNLLRACICRRVFTLDLSFPSFPYSLVHSSGWSRAPWTSFGAGPCVPLGTGAPRNLSGRCCGTAEACCQFHYGNHCRGHPPHYRDRRTLFGKTQAKCRDRHFQSVERSLLSSLVRGSNPSVTSVSLLNNLHLHYTKCLLKDIKYF